MANGKRNTMEAFCVRCLVSMSMVLIDHPHLHLFVAAALREACSVGGGEAARFALLLGPMRPACLPRGFLVWCELVFFLVCAISFFVCPMRDGCKF